MSVFLRLLAMSWSHAGCGRPGLSRSASLRTWWTSAVPSACLHSSHRPAWSRVTSSFRRTLTGRGAWSVRTAFLLRRNGIPPNRATSGLRPSRSTLTSKHLRGPDGVVMVVLWRSAIWVTVESCLAGRMGCAARSRVLVMRAFSAQPSSEPSGHLLCTGLSSDYAVFATGFAWMWSWQCGADDERLAPHFRHEGCPRGLARSWPAEAGEPGDLVDSHRGAVLA